MTIAVASDNNSDVINVKLDNQTYEYFKHLNFGEVDSSYVDLFDCVKELGMTMLSNDCRDKVLISIGGDVKTFGNEDLALDYYADFLKQKAIFSYSRNFFRAILACAMEESDDGLFDYGLDSEGTIVISDGCAIDEDLDGELFCIVQQINDADIEIINNEIHCDGEVVPANELDNLSGYMTSLEDYNCVLKR